TQSYVGTLGFAPPEGPGSVAADIYSLGKVLYEACTGRDRQEFPELPTELSVSDDQHAALVELNEIVLKACDNDPRARYASAESMRADLSLLESGKSVAHLHAAERRFAKLKRLSAIGAVVGLFAMAALVYQSHETAIVRKLAAQNQEYARKS